MKRGKCLKSVLAVLIALVIAPNIFGCPTCVGRLRLGVRKPFFEQYKPKPIDKRDRKKKVAHKESDPEEFWIKLRSQLERQEKFFEKRKRRKL